MSSGGANKVCILFQIHVCPTYSTNASLILLLKMDLVLQTSVVKMSFIPLLYVEQETYFCCIFGMKIRWIYMLAGLVTTIKYCSSVTGRLWVWIVETAFLNGKAACRNDPLSTLAEQGAPWTRDVFLSHWIYLFLYSDIPFVFQRVSSHLLSNFWIT